MVVAMFTWGGSWVSAKILVTILPEHPMTIGMLRFLMASVFFIILLKTRGVGLRRVFNRLTVKTLFGVAVTGIFGYGVFFLVGMQFTTAAQGAIIAGLNPMMVSIFAHMTHGERLRRRWQYVGFIFGFVGVVFVIGVQALIEFNYSHLLGNLCIVCATVTWGLYSSIGKHAMNRQSPVEVNTGGIMLGALLFGFAATSERFWEVTVMLDPLFLWNILFLALFTTFVGFLFYFESIKKIGITRTGVFINLVPVFGTVLSHLILQEEIYWTFAIGLVLVVLGIIFINVPTNRIQDQQPHNTDEVSSRRIHSSS